MSINGFTTYLLYCLYQELGIQCLQPSKQGGEIDNKISGHNACYEENKAECEGFECLREVGLGVILDRVVRERCSEK